VRGIALHPGMVEVAHAQTPPSGAPLEGRQGETQALPCADATFDVVRCQQGFPCMPDMAGVLRELYRVLVPGERLTLSVWRSLEEHPSVRALAEALEPHGSPKAGASMRAPCGCGNAETFRTVLTAAGVRTLHLDHVTLPMRHATPAAYIPGQ
jgi:SAM-dependent methyltransferase